ncbi:unnamed protein product [Amoebophrya sp. A120]|nr:unnamed protein product [Amoebophrya sp. A120]|eukprot:GSA120T00018933001.1
MPPKGTRNKQKPRRRRGANEKEAPDEVADAAPAVASASTTKTTSAPQVANVDNASALLSDPNVFLLMLYQLQHPEKIIMPNVGKMMECLWLTAVMRLHRSGWTCAGDPQQAINHLRIIEDDKEGCTSADEKKKMKNHVRFQSSRDTEFYCVKNGVRSENVSVLDVHLEDETWQLYLMQCVPMLTTANVFAGRLRWPVEVVHFNPSYVSQPLAVLDILCVDEDGESYAVMRNLVQGAWRGIDVDFWRPAVVKSSESPASGPIGHEDETGKSGKIQERAVPSSANQDRHFGQMDMAQLPGMAPQDSWLTSTMFGLTALTIRTLMNKIQKGEHQSSPKIKILFVGLGCGQLVSAIARYFYRDNARLNGDLLQLDVVEPNNQVFEYAKTFFGFAGTKAVHLAQDGAPTDEVAEEDAFSIATYQGPGKEGALRDDTEEQNAKPRAAKKKKSVANLRALPEVISARVFPETLESFAAREENVGAYDIVVVGEEPASTLLQVTSKENNEAGSSSTLSQLNACLRNENLGTLILREHGCTGGNIAKQRQKAENKMESVLQVAEFQLRGAQEEEHGSPADDNDKLSKTWCTDQEDVVVFARRGAESLELSLHEWDEQVVEAEDRAILQKPNFSFGQKDDADLETPREQADEKESKQPPLPTLRDAQQMPVVKLRNVLTADEISQIERLAQDCADERIGSEVRSHDKRKAWKVLFLQQGLRFQTEFPEICEKILQRVKKADKENWDLIQDGNFNMRVIEYHRQVAPSPGLPDPWHYDQDSLLTLDILLSESVSSFSGGDFGTLEKNGDLEKHNFESQGDALLFVSHKYHCVQPVTAGERRVLVIEFWRWPTRSCGHRCEVAARRSCPLEEIKHVAGEASVEKNDEKQPPPTPKTAEKKRNELQMEGQVDVSACLPLPMRLGNVSEQEQTEESSSHCLRILWQSNEVQAGKFTALPETLDQSNEAWDLFD